MVGVVAGFVTTTVPVVVIAVKLTTKLIVPLADRVCVVEGVIEVRVKPVGGAHDSVLLPVDWL
jgi:hypothetical protein